MPSFKHNLHPVILSPSALLCNSIGAIEAATSDAVSNWSEGTSFSRLPQHLCDAVLLEAFSQQDACHRYGAVTHVCRHWQDLAVIGSSNSSSSKHSRGSSTGSSSSSGWSRCSTVSNSSRWDVGCLLSRRRRCSSSISSSTFSLSNTVAGDAASRFLVMLGTLAADPSSVSNHEAATKAKVAAAGERGGSLFPKQKMLKALIAVLENSSDDPFLAAAASSSIGNNCSSTNGNSSSSSNGGRGASESCSPQCHHEHLGCAVLVTLLVAAPPRSPVQGMEQQDWVELVRSYLAVTAGVLPVVLQVRSYPSWYKLKEHVIGWDATALA